MHIVDFTSRSANTTENYQTKSEKQTHDLTAHMQHGLMYGFGFLNVTSI